MIAFGVMTALAGPHYSLTADGLQWTGSARRLSIRMTASNFVVPCTIEYAVVIRPLSQPMVK